MSKWYSIHVWTEAEHYSTMDFTHITGFKALNHYTSIEGRAQTFIHLQSVYEPYY